MKILFNFFYFGRKVAQTGQVFLLHLLSITVIPFAMQCLSFSKRQGAQHLTTVLWRINVCGILSCSCLCGISLFWYVVQRVVFATSIPFAVQLHALLNLQSSLSHFKSTIKNSPVW